VLTFYLPIFGVKDFCSVADPGSGAFVIRDPEWVIIKIRIRDEHPGSYFRDGKTLIRDKHRGSATLGFWLVGYIHCTVALNNVDLLIDNSFCCIRYRYRTEVCLCVWYFCYLVSFYFIRSD
jgi:hypothetical protein